MGVDLQGLQETTRGLQDTLDVLREIGMHGQEESGSPIEQLGLSGRDLGDEQLAGMVGDLLARAHYLFRDLLGDGRDLVQALTDTRTTYERVEDSIAGGLRSLAHVLDPSRDPLEVGDGQ